jgi:hypothetical protein
MSGTCLTIKANEHNTALCSFRGNKTAAVLKGYYPARGCFPLPVRSGEAPYHVVVARVGIAVVVRTTIAVACSQSTVTLGRDMHRANHEPAVYIHKTEGVSGPAQEAVLATTDFVSPEGQQMSQGLTFGVESD